MHRKFVSFSLRLVITLALVVNSGSLDACSCDSPKSPWSRINSYEIILLAKTVQQIKVGNRTIYDPESYITQLHVLDIFKGHLNDSIIYFLNGQSSMCTSTIHLQPAGDTLIIKANFTQTDFINPDISRTYITNNICDPNNYQIKNYSVKPYFKKRIIKARMRKYRKMLKDMPQKAHQYYEQNITNAESDAYISYTKFLKIMKRKLK